MIWLLLLFALTAMLYASVGFGGGSTYTALLALTETDHRVLPLVSLTCNLLVTAGSVWHFRKAGLYKSSNLTPILLVSVPASFLGGLTPISAPAFYCLLGVMLVVAGISLLADSVRQPASAPLAPARAGSSGLAAGIGLVIGYVSGLVGIGGGIFLAPVLHFLSWDQPKRIAAAASLYIAANSVAAFAGKLAALGDSSLAASALSEHWPLAIAVLAGGAAGRHLMTSPVPERAIKAGTAVLILFVACTILLKWWNELL